MEIRRITQPVRKCGKRKDWAFYLVPLESSADGILPHFSVVDTPIPVQREPHRTAVVVHGDVILSHAPEAEWLAGSSAQAAEKKQGDAWAIQTFGMTLTKRLTTGDCRGLKSADEVIEHLVRNVHYSRKIADQVRELSIMGVQEFPRCSEPFAAMIRHLQVFALGDASGAVGFVAAVWRLANTLQPAKTSLVLPRLSAILMYSGLRQDAKLLITALPEKE